MTGAVVSFGHVARLQISWQAQRFVNLDVQSSWQAQKCRFRGRRPTHSLTLPLSHTLTHTRLHSHSHSHSLTTTATVTTIPTFITTITSLDPNASRSLHFLLMDLTHTVWGLLPGYLILSATVTVGLDGCEVLL